MRPRGKTNFQEEGFSAMEPRLSFLGELSVYILRVVWLTVPLSPPAASVGNKKPRRSHSCVVQSKSILDCITLLDRTVGKNRHGNWAPGLSLRKLRSWETNGPIELNLRSNEERFPVELSGE